MEKQRKVESIKFVFLYCLTMRRNEFGEQGYVSKAGKCSRMFGRVPWELLTYEVTMCVFGRKLDVEQH